MAVKEKVKVVTTKYKVLAGFHSDGENTYRKGQVFSSKKPLDKMFPNKFQVLGTSEVTEDGEKVEKDAIPKKKKARYNRVKPLEEIGKDVSAKFPDALNQGMRVWQTEEGEYHVTEERDLYTPLNRKPMTRSATKKFLLER